MDNSFLHLTQQFEKIALLKDLMVDRWIESPALATVFAKYNMERDYFKTHYAHAIVDLLFSRLSEDGQKMDNAPLHRFVDYMKNRDVIMEDLYLFSSTMRQEALKILMEHFPAEHGICMEFQQLADENFQNVITYFNRGIFSDDGTLEDQLQLFKEYQKVIDKSAIVSKADKTGTITYVNAAFVAISGFTRDELIGQQHSIVRHPDMPAATFEKMWKTIQAKKIYHGVIKNQKRNGETYYVDTTIVPILDRDNEIVEYIAMRYDVTKFAEAVAAAKQAQKAKDEFLSNMSHEIRTPLNAIMGFVQILLKTIKEPKHLEKLEVVQQSSKSLLHIINDILDFSKIESGHFKIDPHESDLEKEFSGVVDLFNAKMQEKNITFLSYIDPELPTCLLVDSVRVKQIVSNLLSNAVKFTGEQGTIAVDVLYDPLFSHLKISVQDSGIGISHEQLAKIFNPFEQADGSISRKFGGTGLGLSISEKLAQLMGGQITVQSKENEGSKFSLLLPVKRCSDYIPDDFDRFKARRVVIYRTDTSELDNAYYELLKRYLGALGITNISEIKDLEAIECAEDDYFIFNGETITHDTLEIITNLQARAIALMPLNNMAFEESPVIRVLSLPLSASKMINALDYKAEKVESDKAPSHCYRGQVLVAEDNRSNQQIIQIFLEDFGVSVTFASNGVEAVAMFKRVHFDMVLMDNQMPYMGGIEATKLIRQHESENNLGHTPIVALTANVLKGEREEFLASGMDDFLAKPIDTDALEGVLGKYLKSGNERPQSPAAEAPLHQTTEGENMTTLAEIAAAMGIKEKHVRMVLMTFIEEFGPISTKLAQAMADKDYEQIAYQAHAIKGSSGNLRFNEMSERARGMELAGKASDSAYDYQSDFDRIQELFEEIRKIDM